MAKRQTTFLLKRSNVPGKIPPISGLTSGELALNTADAILYTSGSTSGTILPIGWDRVSRTGDTMTGSLFAPSISATTISATTYYNLPTDIFTTGGTYSNNTFTYTNNTGGTFSTLFNTMTGLTITGNLTVTGGTSSLFSGNSSSTMVRIVQTGSGNAFSVEDATSPDINPFIIDSNGIVGIGTNTPGSYNARLVVAATVSGEYGVRSTGFNNHGMIGNALSIGYAGVYGISSTDGVGNGIGVYGRAEAADTGFNGQIWVGGKFEATGDSEVGTNYSLWLLDGTQGVNKVLVSQTSDGKSNWSSTLSGLTGVYTNTISATTYSNLPIDIRVTGGTFNDTTGVATFTNNTGGTFNVNGFSIGGGGSVFTGGTVTGPTVFTNGLTANTISATTYFNLPTDVRVTGGTYTNGAATFTNNTGGTFTVTGFSTGGTSSTDTFVTGATYSNNTFTYRNNTGGTFNVLFNTLTGLTVNGSMSANHVYVVSATTGTSVSNLGIQSDGKIIKAGGNAIVDNFYYSVSNSTDTTFFEDDKVRLKWDETGNDLKFTMKVEPSGSADMRSLGVLMGSNTTFNVAIVTPNLEYDLYSAGISAGNRMEAFVTAENDQTYPAYHITAYNTGESFHNTIWVQRITRI